VDELDRDMLRVGRVRSATEGEQPAASKEALGHFAARLGQASGLSLEEQIEDRIPGNEGVLDPGGEMGDD
jgi:hypothetical protein